MTIERLLTPSCRLLCDAEPGPGLLGQPCMVPVHGVCRIEPVPVGVHQLVSHDEYPPEVGYRCLGRAFVGWERAIREDLERLLTEP